MRNQTSFRLVTTVLPTDVGADHTAKTTNVINKVDADGNPFKPTFTEETVVITNDDRTVMETTRASCTDGVLTFIKRGLSDDSSATEVDNRKLTWNPGSICFITAGASDWIDPDDDITWTGKQTYSDDMVSTGKATYKGRLITEKGVEYPSFANTTCLQAYSSPFGGMFATVDDTGELYRYNAVTCCWDMVSSVALGTYEIRCSCTAPAAGTADTIVTIAPPEGEIYLGETLVSQVNPRYADVLVVGGGGLGGDGGSGDSYNTYRGGGGGGAGGFGEVMKFPIDSTTTVKVGCSNCRNKSCTSNNCGMSSFGTLIALQGGAGGGVAGAGGTLGAAFNGAYQTLGGKGVDLGGCYCTWGGGGAGALSNGNGATGVGSAVSGGCGKQSLINNQTYGYGGPGGKVGGGCAVCGSGGGGIGGDCKKCCGCTSCAAGGIVVVRYPADGSYGYSCATGGTVSTCCMNGVNYCLHTFTSDGTFCIVS